ncbi:MAG: hypothetical protein H8D67_30930 [Deltaproteobacteria bacterium]|nr:hypothetical protein [Deltaproteobacteria bacterium]
MEENENVSKVELGYAIEGNLVILNVVKASFGLDLTPQGRTKSSTWGSFEPNGLLPVALEMLDCDFLTLEDGSRTLSEQGTVNLFGRVAKLGVAGTRASYDGMLRREEDF